MNSPGEALFTHGPEEHFDVSGLVDECERWLGEDSVVTPDLTAAVDGVIERANAEISHEGFDRFDVVA